MNVILAAVDFSEVSQQVIAQAAALGRAFGAAVHLVHVEAPEPDFVGYEPGPQYVRDHLAKAIGKNVEQLAEARDRLRQDAVDAHSLVVQGPTVEKIIEETSRLGADVIVVGSHGHRFLRDLLMGSTCEGVVRHARCPVLVVPSAR